MFCYQCEQTYRSDDLAGCSDTKGICGKDAATADLQDVLIHVCKGIGQYAIRARALDATDAEADRFLLYAFFTTLTNVNFNANRFVDLIAQAAQIRDRVKATYEAAARGAGKSPEAVRVRRLSFPRKISTASWPRPAKRP
jgi:hydroxylamine reductase